MKNDIDRTDDERLAREMWKDNEIAGLEQQCSALERENQRFMHEVATLRKERDEARAEVDRTLYLATEAWTRWETMHAEQEALRKAGRGVSSGPRDKFEAYLDCLVTDAKDILATLPAVERATTDDVERAREIGAYMFDCADGHSIQAMESFWQNLDEMVAEALSAAREQGRVEGARDGWKEATIAWAVCASIHREYAKGKDALFIARQADFVTHEEDARKRALPESEP